MVNLLKAFALFTFGFTILANRDDATEKQSDSPTIKAIDEEPSSIEDDDFLEKLSPTEKPVLRHGTYAQVCASFDPIARPEEVIDILEYAAAVTGTPVDVLVAVWRKETGYLDGAGTLSGKCDVMSELALRDDAAGTRHSEAMRAMAERFGWNLDRMTCSCPGKDKATGERKGFGGCCGPFQFSAAEVDDEYALPLNLDPMRFCDGALIVGWELKKHHDNAFKPRKTRAGILPGRGTVIMARHGYKDREYAAWHAAMSRYYGGDRGGIYGVTAMAKLMEFSNWRRTDTRQPGHLIGKILGLKNTQYSIRYRRKL